MVGEQLVVFFEPFRIEGLYDSSYLLMNLLSPLEKQAVIGDLLGEGMFEDIGRLGIDPPLIEEFRVL